MRGFAQIVVFSLAAVCGTSALSRERREVNCGAEFEAYSNCGVQAAQSVGQINPQDASAIPKAGCNMIEAVLNCSKKISSACKVPAFDDMMKTTLESSLKTLQGLPGWEDDKCAALVNFRKGGMSGATEKVVSVSLLAMVLGRLLL